MASGYVPQVQKVAGMGIVEREMTTEGSNDIYLEEHHPRSMDKNGSDISMKSTTDVENHAPAQPRGVADMEAVTVIWTKNWLIAAYATIMLISFINSLQQQTNYAFRPYVVSAFQKHGLTAMTDVVANIVGGVSKLPLAKFIDLVGRPQGFLVCMVSVVLGRYLSSDAFHLALVLMAVCQNVQTFCAAQVFYWAGMNGIDYVQNIFIADTSLMQNRLIWMALTGLPYVVNTFAGPSLGETFLDHSTWRWGYGTFAIITPIVSMSFWAVFWLMGRRAKKLGVMKREKSSRTVMQSIRHWCIEFDVIGLLLICGGFSVFLLPFSLAGYQQEGFASPMIICMIVFGLLIIGLFLVWERFYAPRTFFPFKLMKDRSVIAACFLGANSFVLFSSYKMYYSSYLQVVFNLSVAKAGYITNIFFIVSCTWALIISFAFKYTDTYKWGAIIAMPVQILMTGLLIHFREPGTSIGYLVMVEVFGAMASAMLLQIEQVAIMVAVPHEDIAVGLALLSVITAVGGAIGQSVSGALWNQIVPDKIAEYLPEASQDRIMEIFGDLNVQLALPWGSPEREALIKAFADAQKTMLIVGTCALVPCFVWVAMLKNSRMSDRMARKGLQA